MHEKLGVNHKGINQKWYSHWKWGISIIEPSQLKSVKPEMRGCKLRSGVNWEGVLQQKGVKQTDVKQMDIRQGLRVLRWVKVEFSLYVPWRYIRGDLASLTNLTFRGPCSMIHSYNKNQWDALISQIYFWNRTLHVSGRFSLHRH